MKKIFLFFFLCSLIILNNPGYCTEKVIISSPDGRLSFVVKVADGQLYYSVAFGNTPIIDMSALKMTVNDRSITSGGISIGKIKKYSGHEKYRWLGAHSTAVNNFNAQIISLRNKTQKPYFIEVKVFNDGAAYRIVYPGAKGEIQIPDESTEVKLPAGSLLWYHDLSGHYEAVYKNKLLEDVSANEWAAPPLTCKLPLGAGYLAITEADLKNYSGMALQATGKDGFAIRLAHNHPTSGPYKLRYTAEDTLRLRKPAAISGTITTPWRVIMVGSSLNTMVNNDIVHNLCPPPDKKLFPDGIDTKWIKPGRAIWRYLDTPPGEESTPEVVKTYSKLTADLGFEHNILEGFWSRWTDEQIKDVVQYSAERNVGIWLWKHSKSLRDAGERQAFFKRCHDLGVSGVKIDFFDHEHKEVIDLYQDILREAAQYKLLVDFHGANKPTGESRTWPNELTREAVRGMESRNVPDKAAHQTTLPFTRWLAGSAEYTPVHFGERKGNTSLANQIASAAILNAALLTYSAYPQKLLSSPAVDIIKSIPSTWDETIVLPPSEIGSLAVFARRKGNDWFLAVNNGPKTSAFTISLNFLGPGNYHSTSVSDKQDDVNSITVTQAVAKKSDSINLQLVAGGGYIARFSK